MYREIINEICSELGIGVTFLSHDWIIRLEYNGCVKYLAGYKFDLNGHGSGLCVDDKYAMYEVLHNKNIPVIDHKIMYDDNNNEEYAKECQGKDYIYKYFYENNCDIVLKVNNGTCGRGVYHVTNELELDRVIDTIFKRNYSISLCPFYKIDCEYRVIILKGEVLIVYGKIRPIVIGDGKRCVSELLKEFNSSYNYQVIEDYVLEKGEEYCYSWKHNLSNGSKIDMNVDNRDEIISLAKRAANELNLVFGSVDVVMVNGKYMIMECNSGVMMDNLSKMLPNGMDVVKKIYRKAILELFEKNNK